MYEKKKEFNELMCCVERDLKMNGLLVTVARKMRRDE
jgi:hypothetical protein